jgi:hypothetical protein
MIGFSTLPVLTIILLFFPRYDTCKAHHEDGMRSCWACSRLRMQKVFVSGSTLNPHQLNIVLIDYVFWLVYLSDASA